MHNHRNIEVFKKFISIAKFAYVPIAIIFISYLCWINIYVIKDTFTNISLLHLLACISIWLFLHCLSPLFTIISFSQIGTSISYRDAYLIHTSYLPAKYIPGGIWHTVARSQSYCELKITKQNVITYLIQENLIIAAVTLLIGGIIVGAYSNNMMISNLAIILACISVISLIIWPFLKNKFLEASCPTFYLLRYVLSIFLIAIYWITASVSFVIFLNIFPNIDSLCHAIYTAGTYIFSWGIGFIALFAPQGFGISESVAAGLLCTSVAPTALIVLLSSFRIILLLADLLSWISSFYIKKLFQ